LLKTQDVWGHSARLFVEVSHLPEIAMAPAVAGLVHNVKDVHGDLFVGVTWFQHDTGELRQERIVNNPLRF
jgi:hypothetical protein